MFALMEHYVELGDDLCEIESLAEFDRIMAEMNTTKAQIDALIEEAGSASYAELLLAK
jgi:hypothetical protein